MEPGVLSVVLLLMVTYLLGSNTSIKSLS